jgi:hypothetical protein
MRRRALQEEGRKQEFRLFITGLHGTVSYKIELSNKTFYSSHQLIAVFCAGGKVVVQTGSTWECFAPLHLVDDIKANNSM